ncbi:MAG: DEAD/DEAH box helicase family protein [Peptococcaceae bacterium]|nr:DEAD/DEAH box helicase family protein [Peptococcaceae bacterium]
MNYYAHSPKDGISPQTYAAHISGVCIRATRYAQEAGRFAQKDKGILLQTIKKASVYHDLGKLQAENQEVLSGQRVAKKLPVNHVDAGVAHFLREENYSVFSAAVIQAHHVGFPGFSEEMNKGELAFRDVDIALETERELSTMESIHNILADSGFAPEREEVKGDLSVFLRMLLSCIADADHTDTAINYQKYPANEAIVSLRPGERLVQLDKRIEELNKNGVNDKRNILRNEMYKACRDADVCANISSCDSPVGSGKTTAVMAHLLAQAQKRRLRRIFVVLPFTNIIRQSVETYREMLVLPGENRDDVVAELHHRADFEREETRHLTALWRAPIIVTTAVAFFETLASNSTATLRRLHELPGSAVFIDESHAALPASLLPIAWRWMNIFASDWSCYWVLASGSLNRFWSIPEIASASANDFIHVPEIVNDTIRCSLSEYEHNRITYLSDLQPKTTVELAKWIMKFSGPRLLILNTVQSAAVLADYFSQNYGREHVEHLSTALTSTDRDHTIENVKARLTDVKDLNWTLIATSCIEAGMNLSFKNGFRELGSLSSLLQAAGRINRDGSDITAEMWTFCIYEDGMLKLNPGLKQASEVLKGYLGQDIAIIPELTTRSISDEIALYGLAGKHKKLLINEELQNFPQVEHDFKVIDSDTRLVVVDPAVADQLRYGSVDWRKLQKATVQIAKYKLDELKTPVILDNIYRWNLEYDDFLGYMAGIVKLKKYSGSPIII